MHRLSLCTVRSANTLWRNIRSGGRRVALYAFVINERKYFTVLNLTGVKRKHAIIVRYALGCEKVLKCRSKTSRSNKASVISIALTDFQCVWISIRDWVHAFGLVLTQFVSKINGLVIEGTQSTLVNVRRIYL